MAGKFGNESGVALITALIAMVVLVLLVAGVTGLATSGTQLTTANSDHTQALYVAESAIVRTMFELPKYWGKEAELFALLQNGNTGTGDYNIDKIEYIDADGKTVETADINVKYVDVTATASVINSDSTDRVTRTIKVRLLPNWPQYFDYGIAAFSPDKHSLDISGNATIDAYSSSVGYSTSSGYGADIACNGDVHVTSADTTIYGSLYMLPDKDINKGAEGCFEGDDFADPDPVKELSEAVEIKKFDVDYYKNNNDNSKPGCISGSGYNISQMEINVKSQDELTIMPGTYYFTNVTVQGKLNIGQGEGPVIIVTDGGITINSNSAVNPEPGCSTDLRIFAMSPDSNNTSVNITVNGKATFSGGIYAPYTSVTINGGGEFFGALAGKTVKITGDAEFHYDLDLKTVNFGPPTGFASGKWEELAPNVSNR